MVAVTLAASGTPVVFERAHVYFAFGDGRLSYDCVACDALCCRGHGYQLQSEELRAHVAARPTVRFFLQPVGGHDAHHVSNYPPSCFFLASSKKCQIHIDGGFDAKPETCRLFPFNYLRRAGNYLIAAPHLSLCPLRVMPEGFTSETSAHADLFGSMASQPITAPVRQVASDSTDLPLLIALERHLVGLSEEHLNGPYRRFVLSQTAATRQSPLMKSDLLEPEPDIAAELREFEAFLSDVLGESSIDRTSERARTGSNADSQHAGVARRAHLQWPPMRHMKETNNAFIFTPPK